MSAARPLLALLVLAVAVCGSLWQPHDPHAIDLANTLCGPSAAHWLGTDHLGRDVASRLLAGAGPSLATISVALAATLGLGGLAGVAVALGPRALAVPVSRAAEVVLAVPTLVLALVLSGVFGAGPLTVGLALAATAWAPYALTIAGWCEQITAAPYWRAAEALGRSRAGAAWHHLVPNLIAPVGALAGTDAGRAVILVSSLGFLGLAADTGRPEWGAMVHEYRIFLFEAPRLLLAPIAAVAALSLALNLALDQDRNHQVFRVHRS